MLATYMTNERTNERTERAMTERTNERTNERMMNQPPSRKAAKRSLRSCKKAINNIHNNDIIIIDTPYCVWVVVSAYAKFDNYWNNMTE